MLTNRFWWGVVVRFLIHGIVTSTWIARIPFIKSSLHLSDGALGMALLGSAVGSLLAIPVCGLAVTRFGSKGPCLWTSTGLCMALLLPALAVDASSLFAALAVFGAMAGANDVAMNAQAVSAERMLRKPTMSRFHAMFSMGGIAGAAIGGLAASYGIPASRHFAVAGFLNLVLSTAAAPLLLDTRADPAKAAGRISVRRLPVALLILSGIGFCIFLSEGAIADWTAVYLKQVLGATAGMAAAGYAVFSASMTIFRLFGDAITARLGPASTIRRGGLIAAFGLATALVAQSPVWALPGFALAGVGYSSMIPLVFAASGRVPSVAEGAGVAAVSGLGYLGFLFGPPAIGFISELTSLRFGLLMVVVLSAGAGLMVSLIERRGSTLFSYEEEGEPK